MLDYLRDDLRLKCDMLFHHHDTLLKRIQLFLPVEVALLYIVFKDVSSLQNALESVPAVWLCLMGLGTSFMWLLFAVRDYDASIEYRDAIANSRAAFLRAFEKNHPFECRLLKKLAVPGISDATYTVTAERTEQVTGESTVQNTGESSVSQGATSGVEGAILRILGKFKPVFSVRWMGIALAFGMFVFWSFSFIAYLYSAISLRVG